MDIKRRDNKKETRAEKLKRLRVSLKNDYFFRHKFTTDNDFVNHLLDLMDKWKCDWYRKSYTPAGIFDGTNFFADRVGANKQRIQFEARLTNAKRKEFHKDIIVFKEKYNLGKEWFWTIRNFLISGFFEAPGINLYATHNNGRDNRKRVVLELNPDTSLEDIEKVWPEIQKLQKSFYPSFKKTYFSWNKYKNLSIYYKDQKIRSQKKTLLDEVKYGDYKIKDMDIVGQIWEDEEDISEEADRKRKNNLRQIRKRVKKKT